MAARKNSADLTACIATTRAAIAALVVVDTSVIQDTVRAESFDKLRTGSVEAPLPFDRLRANGGFVMSFGKINKCPGYCTAAVARGAGIFRNTISP